jgi:predicted anti-sigma-YlaC factor YlaD
MAYDDIPCREIVELVTDYLEDALSPDVQVAVERHLLICDGCAAYLDQMRETIRLTGALRSDDVPPEVIETLLEAVRTMRR